MCSAADEDSALQVAVMLTLLPAGLIRAAARLLAAYLLPGYEEPLGVSDALQPALPPPLCTRGAAQLRLFCASVPARSAPQPHMCAVKVPSCSIATCIPLPLLLLLQARRTLCRPAGTFPCGAPRRWTQLMCGSPKVCREDWLILKMIVLFVKCATSLAGTFRCRRLTPRLPCACLQSSATARHRSSGSCLTSMCLESSS